MRTLQCTETILYLFYPWKHEKAPSESGCFTGHSFWDWAGNFLHKFTQSILSVHKLNKPDKFMDNCWMSCQVMALIWKKFTTISLTCCKIAEILCTAGRSKTSTNIIFCFIKIAHPMIYTKWLWVSRSKKKPEAKWK